MYLGHLAAGMILKARVPEAPLSWLLFATVASDLVCGLLLMLGAESVIVHGTLVFSHIEADIRYSHSLLANLALSLIVGVISGRYLESTRAGVALGLAVLSHYVLDALSHRPDMPVVGFGASPDAILGTSLAAIPLAHYLVEFALSLLAWAMLDRTNYRLLATILVLMASYANTLFGFIPLPPQSGLVFGATMFVLFLGTPALLLWAARAPGPLSRPSR